MIGCCRNVQNKTYFLSGALLYLHNSVRQDDQTGLTFIYNSVSFQANVPAVFYGRECIAKKKQQQKTVY